MTKEFIESLKSKVEKATDMMKASGFDDNDILELISIGLLELHKSSSARHNTEMAQMYYDVRNNVNEMILEG